MLYVRSVCSAAVVLLAINLAGCGGAKSDKWTEGRQPTYPATGSVTYKGNPLPDATVVFQSSGPEPVTAVARTDASGKFVMRTYDDKSGAVAGEHKVIITAVKVEGPPPGADLDKVDPTVKETSLIPTKYGDFAQSGLTANVSEQGPNTFEFTLED